MKKHLIIGFFIVSRFVFAQTTLPYKPGEQVSYKVFFGAIAVGYADLEVKNIQTTRNKPIVHIIGKGRTTSFFDWFFKVRDVYETFVDTTTLLPLEFKRKVNEGGYLINQHYMFNHKEGIVKTKDSTFLISPHSQDMLSAFFYARTLNKESITQKNNFYIPVFMDSENYLLQIKYQKNEIINTRWGRVDCMVFKPKMQEGRVFKSGEEMKIWISDDANHILVKAETKIWGGGTIKAELHNYKELKHPPSIIIE